MGSPIDITTKTTRDIPEHLKRTVLVCGHHGTTNPRGVAASKPGNQHVYASVKTLEADERGIATQVLGGVERKDCYEYTRFPKAAHVITK